MQLATSFLLLAVPALLIIAVHRLWRRNASQARRVIWIMVTATWAVSAVPWYIYAKQQDDVGLMVYGILGYAALASATLATLTALVIQWRS